jgi:NagD protein
MEAPKNYLIDMDGVLITGGTMIPGADSFLTRLKEREAKFLILTNNSRYTPGDLSHRLHGIGLDVSADSIFTSALATARFLQSQRPNGTAFVIGDSGLTWALHSAGYVITDLQPDYVVLGEAGSYTLESLTKAVRLIEGGAVAALIEKASGVSALFVGKPNPLMMRMALKYLGAHSENTVMIGDRMDTDIIAGVQSGLEPILVLTGVTRREDVDRFPYRPTRIVSSVAEIEP